jgi:hypothetical protein
LHHGKGYTGWVPRRTRPGDEICIFAGASVPYIIRSKQNCLYYELVGDSYVHGFMYGEAVADIGEDWEEIELR